MQSKTLIQEEKNKEVITNTSKIFPIPEVIPQSNIVVFSPHFDDFLFMLGGYSAELKKCGQLGTKKIHINILFSRSNYLARSGKDNCDSSLERVKLATGKRLLEDQECIDEILGRFAYRYGLRVRMNVLQEGNLLPTVKWNFHMGCMKILMKKINRYSKG